MKRGATMVFVAASCAALSILAPAAVRAQAAVTPARNDAAFELWGGLARGSPTWGTLGDTPHMNFGLLALRWSRGLGGSRRPDLAPRYEVSIDLIPIARISPPLTSVVPCVGAATCVLPAAPNGDEGFFPDDSPFGIGVNALGLTRRFAMTPWLAPSIGGTVGALLFEERVPTTGAASFNFTATFEAGLRFGRPSGRTLVLAYRALHISNGGTRRENPGVLSHLVTAGIQYPRRRAAQVASR